MPVKKLVLRCSLALTLSLFLASGVSAFSSGADRGGDSCSPCHNGASTEVAITLDGPAFLDPGASGLYTAMVTVVGAGGALDIAAVNGVLGAVDANTQILNGELTHTSAGTDAPAGNRDDWIYDFMVMAPATQGSVIDLSVAMMAYNGDFGASGDDLWTTTTFSIDVIPEPSTLVLLAGGLTGLVSVARRRKE